MPFNTNAANNSVVYTDGTFSTSKVLTADQTVNNSATLVTVPEFKIPVGKYERFICRWNLFYTTNVAADLKYFVDIPASPTLFRLALTGVNPKAEELSEAPLTAEGSGVAIATDTGTDGFLQLNGIVNNGANAGDIIFQFAQNGAHASDTKILAGSYFEYQLF